MNTNEMRIDAAFKELKMPGATRSWRPLIRDAQTKGQDPRVFLAALLESELISRRENRLRTRRHPRQKLRDPGGRLHETAPR
jgi:hypothetical protein